jgi:hypothetical protein
MHAGGADSGRPAPGRSCYEMAEPAHATGAIIVSKHNRQERQRRQRARAFDTSAAELADRAVTDAERLINAVHRALIGIGRPVTKIRMELIPAARADDLAAGAQWPEWCWYPSVFLGSRLVPAEATDTFVRALSTGEVSVYPLATAAAWHQGRLAVRFDPDLLQALLATPLSGDIPGQVLRRLPAWAFYLDCPHLGSHVGVFVALDAFPTRSRADTTPVEVPAEQRSDELIVIFVAESRDRLVLMNLPLDQGNLADTLAASQPRPFWAQLAEHLGHPADSVVRGVLSMLLYLASADPDVTSRPTPTERPNSAAPSPARGGDVNVMTAGFRVGAALRQADSAERHRTDGRTGRHTAPHLRSAHWHSYWLGPLDQPDLRHVEVRWISPILVNAERADGMTTVVRSVPKPPDAR